jgi:hypothetical protein
VVKKREKIYEYLSYIGKIQDRMKAAQETTHFLYLYSSTVCILNSDDRFRERDFSEARSSTVSFDAHVINTTQTLQVTFHEAHDFCWGRIAN